MEMMFAINRDNFDGHREVTCYSCHRGSADPMGTPPILGEEPKLEAKAAPAAAENSDAGSRKKTTGPSADQNCFDKYVQALGGAAAVDKITSRVAKVRLSSATNYFRST